MLKKSIFLLVVAVFTAGFAQAQFKIGARAGFNLTTITGDKEVVESAKLKPGFQVGVVGDYAFSEAFSIQPGIVFAQQGYKTNETGTSYTYKTTLNLNYIQVPINAQYKFDLGSIKLLLQAGPYLGYGIGGKYKYEWSGADESGKGDGKIKFGDGDENEETLYIDKAFDFGIGAGVGVQVSNFQVAFGYNLGLTSLNKAKDAEGNKKPIVKNGGLQLTLTYLFGKK